MIRPNGVEYPLRSTYRYPAEFEIQHTNRPTDIILFQTKLDRLTFNSSDLNRSNDAVKSKSCTWKEWTRANEQNISFPLNKKRLSF